MLRDPYAVMRALLRAEAARNGTPLPPRKDRKKTPPRKTAPTTADASERSRTAPERGRD
ncbi:hypothetical protein GCM10009535_47820 [Streptomyces thermocarboxydovorans]|uniref:Uncharacterized protein n=1 Tax=Streptomyces thermocarboxydovorans TaxID=59298 RepID=A0ABN1HQ67_9ACTN